MTVKLMTESSMGWDEQVLGEMESRASPASESDALALRCPQRIELGLRQCAAPDRQAHQARAARRLAGRTAVGHQLQRVARGAGARARIGGVEGVARTD